MDSQYQIPASADLFTDEPLVYGGFWERFGASFIDGIILWILSFVISLIVTEDSYNLIILGSASNLILNWLYYALQESGPNQATFGKRALGLRVTTLDGRDRISFGQATGRYFAKILSTIILLIGYFMMLWDDKKQTLHDKLAGTLVVKTTY